jgi:hypothetical protein
VSGNDLIGFISIILLMDAIKSSTGVTASPYHGPTFVRQISPQKRRPSSGKKNAR